MSLSFMKRVEHMFNSGFQILYCYTPDRKRCEGEIGLAATGFRDTRGRQAEYYTWDGAQGFSKQVIDEDGKMDSRPLAAADRCLDPAEALDKLRTKGGIFGDKPVVVVMRNLHPYLEDPTLRQSMQNLYYGKELEKLSRVIVLVGSALKIHTELAACVTVVDFSLPGEEELDSVFETVSKGHVADAQKAGKPPLFDQDGRKRTVHALKGLTMLEAEDTLAYAVRVNNGYGSKLIELIEDGKAAAVGRSEILTYVSKDKIPDMTDIGGYDNVKLFLAQRKLAYTPLARELGLDLPKGIVLLGPPGTAKSVVGKIVAKELTLPLVLFNTSAVFGSLVGESERNIRNALATIDALDGSVVLIDEAEKALGGANEAAGDSGVSRRVFGVILTWLTEKKSSTFVVMTMNRVTGIPPEFLRRGRFDQIFYTDIPTPHERDLIFRIHCQKRGIDHSQYPEKEWQQLIDMTDAYVGAEIEQIVCDARFSAFHDRQTGSPDVEELIEAAKGITPLAKAESANIDAIRKMCVDVGVPVTSQAKQKSAPKKASRVKLS